MLKLVRSIVEHAHFTILLALLVLAYGVISIYRVSLSQDPEIDFPELAIHLLLPGSSPGEMQRNVVFPIETELRSAKDLTDIRTTIRQGSALIAVKFKHGADTVQKANEVESAVNSIRRKLPEQLEFNVVKATVSDQVVAFVLAVAAPAASSAERNDVAFDLVNAVLKVPHVKNVRMVRADEDVVVKLDLTRMNWLDISVDQVVAAIQSDNAFAASGNLTLDGSEVRFSGPESRYETPADLTRTMVFSAAGNPVSLRDIAEIEVRPRGDAVSGQLDSQPVTFVEVGADFAEANILTLRDQLVEAVQTFEQTLPKGFSVEMVFDQSEGVRGLVFGLVQNLAQGLVILFAVLLFAVGFRSTLIISSVVPLAFLIALAILSFSDFGIQQVSLAGFVIALGLIVDNGIVVTENAYILEKYHGRDRASAAIEGTAPAISPLLSSTLTTMLAFAPLFLLSSDAAVYLRSLSASIWLCLLSSLFMAVTMVTLLLAKVGTIGPFLGIPNPPSYLNGLIGFREGPYRWLLTVAVRWRALTVLLFLGLLVFALSLGAGLRTTVFPATGDPYLTVNLTLPSPLSESSRIDLTRKVEEAVHQFDAVEQVSTLIGRNFPWVSTSMNNVGDIVLLVRTRTGDETELTRLAEAITGALHPFRAYADVGVFLFQRRDLAHQSPFSLVISGSDVREVSAYARAVDDVLRDVEGVGLVRNPMKSNHMTLRLDFLHERAALLGVSKSDTDLLVGMLTYGYEVDRFRDGRGREYPIVLKVDVDEAHPLQALRAASVVSASGHGTPISEVVQMHLAASESRITHHQFEPHVTIDLWTGDGYADEDAARNVLDAIAGISRPDGVSARIGGALRKKQEDFQGLAEQGLMIGALMFAVLVLQFRSFAQPLIVITAVPLCVIGAIIGLVVTEQPMTFFAAVGITSLMGIVINDSILLVDEGNRILREETSAAVAAVEAGCKRFMPVLLTSVTTVCGLLPMAFGSSMFKTMAITICGGLVSSTFLILVLVPVLYSYLSPGRAAPGEAT